ncbi:MAG: carbohydrate-binding family 9-like protein [Bacteroidota bacterium]|nr:carbohydrate-binding family 9-like protein [Bacteroidota bacterium]
MKNSLLLIIMILSLFSCIGDGESDISFSGTFLPYHEPNHYICCKTSDMVVDGVLDDNEWDQAQWTELFKDIQGDELPAPRYNTRAKMAWSNDYLFIAVEIEEPHVWATITERDAVIFYDNDFEVFIDPDGDTHHYSELEINAFETVWDLMLTMPYRDFGYAVDAWDIAGLKVGVSVQGTINDPSDVDQGWTIEIAIPFNIIEECAPYDDVPSPDDFWRINFSRVEWKTEVVDGKYVKQVDPDTGKSLPEDNWVWSPQYHINMHMPEYWGYIVFSDAPVGNHNSSWSLPVDEKTKWYLRNVYYLQSAYLAENQRYAEVVSELGWPATINETKIPVPNLQVCRNGFNAVLPSLEGNGYWMINEKGHIKKLSDLNE